MRVVAVLIACYLMSAQSLVTAQSATPRWAGIPDVCAGMRAAGWAPEDPLGGTGGGQARVGGRARIDLCKGARQLPSAAGARTPSRLTLFMQYRGGSNVSLAGEIWNEADRATVLTAMRAELDRLARTLRFTVPPDVAAAVSAADAAEDEAPGVSYRVSTETRAAAIMGQPDVKPEQVPLLLVSLEISEEP